ncbi:Hpt domain-containing protein [Klenkia terrae]|uniref:Hpt domain-containing protein n=1 Tax=Klenkia terrae TaxID=1052259 RepID=UPI00360FC04F
MDGLDDIVEDFLVESHENLDQLDRDLVALEQEPNSRERLSSIFRTIHTIKGTSGFLAFGKLEQVAHVGENMLSRLRDGALQLTPHRTDALLTMVDTVRELLGSIETTGGEGSVDVSRAVELISASMEDGPAAEAPAADPVAAEAVVEAAAEVVEEELAALEVAADQLAAVAAPAAAAPRPSSRSRPRPRSPRRRRSPP